MELTATTWSTVEEKEKFISHFKKFVKAGFPEKMFNKPFYNRMSLMRRHIAHYNKYGFFETHFSTAERRADFLQRWTLNNINGDPAYTWSDAEAILSAWLRDNPNYEATERMTHDALIEAIERRELARLTVKYA